MCTCKGKEKTKTTNNSKCNKKEKKGGKLQKGDVENCDKIQIK
jgi:hypothetical protein